MVLTVFGVKFKFRIPVAVDNPFFNRKIPSRSILLIEPNYYCHRETLLGYAKYLCELGYNVDILVCNLGDNSFIKGFKDLQVFQYSPEQIFLIVSDKRLSRYERVIFNSKVLYDCSANWIDVHVFCDNLRQGKKLNIFVQHHIDRIDEIPEDKQIILANPAHKEEYNKIVVNPHYFGHVNITGLNKDKIRFCVIGALENKRKNIDILFDAIRKLDSLGIERYEITIVGAYQEQIASLEPVLMEHIVLAGKLSFPEMYKVIEKSDYILLLLDPENPEHDRYLKDGTSGGFQLVYGFLKPCIIQEKFANAYNFNNFNSVVYKDNISLPDAMARAIKKSPKEYEILQNNLLTMEKEIYSESLENLRFMLDGK